jgi:hypothetical protein
MLSSSPLLCRFSKLPEGLTETEGEAQTEHNAEGGGEEEHKEDPSEVLDTTTSRPSRPLPAPQSGDRSLAFPSPL